MNRIQLTADNSNLLLTRSNFCFPSDHFCIIFPRKLELRFKRVKSWGKKKTKQKKNTVYWNPRHWIQLKTTVSFFCPPLFFVTQIQCAFPCVSYQALLLNSLFTISIFISCCLWSDVLSKISYWCCCSHTVYCKLVK